MTYTAAPQAIDSGDRHNRLHGSHGTVSEHCLRAMAVTAAYLSVISHSDRRTLLGHSDSRMPTWEPWLTVAKNYPGCHLASQQKLKQKTSQNQ